MNRERIARLKQVLEEWESSVSKDLAHVQVVLELEAAAPERRIAVRWTRGNGVNFVLEVYSHEKWVRWTEVCVEYLVTIAANLRRIENAITEVADARNKEVEAAIAVVEERVKGLRLPKTLNVYSGQLEDTEDSR